ncbi:MAG: hypothetical protein PHW75_02705 [Patescibacteria group bacterium]|nr:hypothetical protein [Patescibacteria group bacterium]
MKKLVATILLMVLSISLSPSGVTAQVSTGLETPTHQLPVDGAYVTTSHLNTHEIDWDDVVVEAGVTVEYRYQSSLDNGLESDGSFASPIFTSGWLSESEILAADTPEGTYYWHVMARDANNTSKVSDWSVPWELNVDNTAPTLISVIIASSGDNEEWSKTGDEVSIVFVADEALGDTEVRIAGQPATTIESISPMIYKATRTMTMADTEGNVDFEIEYSDAAGNNGILVDATTDSSSVTFDRTVPEVKTFDEYQADLTVTASVIEEPKNYLTDSGVYVADNYSSEGIEIRTKWEIVKTNDYAKASYKVTYVAKDKAGNETTSTPVLFDLTSAEKLPTGTFTIELLPELSVKTEKGMTYEDSGASASWASGYLNVWTFGDLDLTKTGDYELGYMANVVVPLKTLGTSPTYKTRDISVVDTTPVSPVSNLVVKGYDGYVALSWDNPTEDDFAGVLIYRSQTKGVRGDLIAITSPETDRYEDYTVVNGKTYYYTLVAIDGESPANESAPTIQAGATPKQIKVASVTNVTSDYSDDNEVTEEQDVKSDQDENTNDEDQNQNNGEEDSSNAPTVGIIILILLIALGTYLLYLQNPEMFEKLAFWKKNK